MSRIGKLPVVIPAGVKVAVDGNTVKVEGPKGKLEKTFASAVKITLEDGAIHFAPASNSRFSGAMHGTARSVVNAMVEGVSKGFEKCVAVINGETASIVVKCAETLTPAQLAQINASVFEVAAIEPVNITIVGRQ